MVIVGSVLLVVALVAVSVAMYQRGTWYLMAVTETLTSAQLREEVAAVRGIGGGGGYSGYSRVCEVVGAAQPGPDGPLTATVSTVPCVWHRHVIRRRYRPDVADGEGGRRGPQRTEVVSDVTSGDPFTVVDGTGAVLVAPDGTRIDRPERVQHDFRPDPSGASLAALGVTLRVGGSDGTVGFEIEEWVIRPGTQLYVLGEVTERGGGLRMGRPAEGRFIISTRTEAELTAGARRVQRVCMATAAAAALAGTVTAVAGLVA